MKDLFDTIVCDMDTGCTRDLCCKGKGFKPCEEVDPGCKKEGQSPSPAPAGPQTGCLNGVDLPGWADVHGNTCSATNHWNGDICRRAYVNQNSAGPFAGITATMACCKCQVTTTTSPETTASPSTTSSGSGSTLTFPIPVKCTVNCTDKLQPLDSVDRSGTGSAVVVGPGSTHRGILGGKGVAAATPPPAVVDREVETADAALDAALDLPGR